jgi:putative cell wall-associated hydrolase
MVRKKQKKEQNKEITIMVLYDTQKKPFQFRIPILFIKSTCVFVALITVIAGFLFSRNLMLGNEVANTAASNADLNRKVNDLENVSNQIQKQNQALQNSVITKESQVEELKGLAEDTGKQLEELYNKEKAINEQIDSVLPGSSKPVSDAGSANKDEAVAQSFDSGSLDTNDLGTDESFYMADDITNIPLAVTPIPYTPRMGEEDSILNDLDMYNMRIASANIQGLQLVKRDDSANTVKAKFLELKEQMERQSEEYETYMNVLTSKEFKNELVARERRKLRAGVISFARQFLGGRYVYGGENPHSGVDCSGFSRYVLGNSAGVWLSRTAASQSQQGRRVDINSAKAGDLIFYGNGSSVNHVAVYMGNGKVIHASNERNGIMISNWNYRPPVVIKNMIGD